MQAVAALEAGEGKAPAWGTKPRQEPGEAGDFFAVLAAVQLGAGFGPVVTAIAPGPPGGRGMPVGEPGGGPATVPSGNQGSLGCAGAMPAAAFLPLVDRQDGAVTATVPPLHLVGPAGPPVPMCVPAEIAAGAQLLPSAAQAGRSETVDSIPGEPQAAGTPGTEGTAAWTAPSAAAALPREFGPSTGVPAGAKEDGGNTLARPGPGEAPGSGAGVAPLQESGRPDRSSLGDLPWGGEAGGREIGTPAVQQGAAEAGGTEAPRPVVLAREIVHQGLAVWQKGYGHVRLKLHPETLGEVRLEVTGGAGRIAAHLVVENEAARSLVQAALPHLQQQLADHGLTCEHFSVEVGNFGGGGYERGSGSSGG
ncbi:MAG: flagellar hook-length control protein FliK, partial [Clostridia bacterium]|nr:flagellar hook-length control protein FliK [Clostridia bacterium]